MALNVHPIILGRTVAANVQRVRVVNWPTASPTPHATPDPVAISALHAAWVTVWLTAGGVLIASLAAYFALRALNIAIADARRNQEQLALLLRKPVIALGLWTNAKGGLGMPMKIGAPSKFGPSKRYIFEVAVHNTGKVQADNYRLSLLLKRASKASFNTGERNLTYLPMMNHGAAELISISDTTAEEWDEVYFEGRTIQVTPNPIALCQITVYTSEETELEVAFKLRLSCDGGSYFEHDQLITLM